MVTGDICVKAYTPSTVFMFKLATSNNFVLLLDDKIASLLSVVMPGSRCTCKHKRGWEVLRKRGVRNKQVSLSLSRTVIPDTLKRCVEIIKHKQNTVSQVCVNIPRGRCLKTGLFNIKTMAERMRNFCCTTCMDCVAHILTYTQTHARTFRCSYHFVEIGEKVRSATHPSR